ncbi:MAG: class I SAM-dependent methyltransferase [Chloroflexi bacterium]|nr:class I SAM-dependent methyltransferase [Chloroflexota bacterium]
MEASLYDQIADFYYDFVHKGLSSSDPPEDRTISTIFEISGDIQGKRVCDLACGEGHLSRMLAQRGAIVTGVDLSINLLQHAIRQSEGLNISYVLDNAHTLIKLGDGSFDIVICKMALMDIPDIVSTFEAVNRILERNGKFIFAILHPCFETPFTVPEKQVELDENGRFVAWRVRRYTDEGYWKSGGIGIRGRVGAYHRMLSTYINVLLESGFQLNKLAEPILPKGEYAELEDQLKSQIPSILIVSSIKN